jgi:hypothetical protein
VLIGFIKHNRAVSIVLLPVALVFLWIYGFLHPVVPLTEHAAPLYKLLISGIGNHPFLITLISFILIFCEALLINYIVEKNEIIDTTTYLPALIYIILMSLQPEMFSLHPIIIANLFILFALHKLMQTYRKETAFSEAFDTGFFISLACLFYIPSMIFIILLWIGLIIIRPFIWREWAISFIGLLLPWTYLIFAYFWYERLDMLQYDALYYTLIVPAKSFSNIHFSIAQYFQVVLLLVAAFFTAGRFSRDFNKGTVRLRSNLSVILYFFILAIISLVLAPKYSIAYLSFLSIPFSILFSSYLLFAKKEWIAEVLFILLIISVFINQFIH